LQRQAGDEYGVAVALTNLAICHVMSGDLAGALAGYEAVLPILDRFATPQPRIKTCNNIAYVRLQLGDREGSIHWSERAMALAEAAAIPSMIAFAAGNAAVRAVALGDFAGAEHLARRVGEIPDSAIVYVAYALVARAAVAHAAGDHARMRRFASAARLLQRDCAEFEPFEAGILAPLAGDAEDAVDRDLDAGRALCRS
jgi:hypothetical protein